MPPKSVLQHGALIEFLKRHTNVEPPDAQSAVLEQPKNSQPFRDLATPQLGLPPLQLLQSLSYSHFAELIAVEDPFKRRFYEQECIRGSWSVRELKRQIASLYFERSKLSTNKKELADVEDALLDKLQDFLLELGNGFCFEARQKRILIGDSHYFVDLVFYHRVLKCHVLVELKLAEFNHQNIGQLNTYVSWYRRNMNTEGDNPPIGILLCSQKNSALVEYALAGIDNEIFVSKYLLELPSKEEVQRFIEMQLAAP